MASFEEQSGVGHSTGPMGRLKSHHRRAFESLTAALDLDEGGGGGGGSGGATVDNKLERLARLYRQGVDELKRGLAVRFEGKGADGRGADATAEAEKFRRLQDKMRGNLTQAEERLTAIEAEVAAKLQEAKLTAGPAARASARESRPAKPPASGPVVGPAGKKQQPPPLQPHQNHRRPASAVTPVVAHAELKGVDPALANSILNEVLDKSPGITFDDVVGNETAKQTLREATVLPSLRPDLFQGLRQPASAVLLFGPPGNGKTLLAKAVATEAKSVFFNISAGSLVSKWVGEAEKLVRALFALARKLAPAVIFVDEVDSILSQRSDRETEVSRRLKTQFLVELDGVSGGGGGGGGGSSPRILLLAATNRPGEIDSAVVRRFGRRLYVGMPDAEGRAGLLAALLARHDSVRVTRAELAELADLTEGYSASDLANLAREAAMEPLRQIRPDRLATVAKEAVRPLVAGDLRACLSRVRPSVPPESIRELTDWNDKYGDATSG